jgi:hypothetical protein
VASVAPQDTRTAFSLDICHPIQAINTASVACNLPTLVASAITHELQEFGFVPVIAPLVVALAAEAPDPPPPKSIIR